MKNQFLFALTLALALVGCTKVSHPTSTATHMDGDWVVGGTATVTVEGQKESTKEEFGCGLMTIDQNGDSGAFGANTLAFDDKGATLHSDYDSFVFSIYILGKVQGNGWLDARDRSNLDYDVDMQTINDSFDGYESFGGYSLAYELDAMRPFELVNFIDTCLTGFTGSNTEALTLIRPPVTSLISMETEGNNVLVKNPFTGNTLGKIQIQ